MSPPTGGKTTPTNNSETEKKKKIYKTYSLATVKFHWENLPPIETNRRPGLKIIKISRLDNCSQQKVKLDSAKESTIQYEIYKTYSQATVRFRWENLTPIKTNR